MTAEVPTLDLDTVGPVSRKKPEARTTASKAQKSGGKTEQKRTATKRSKPADAGQPTAGKRQTPRASTGQDHAITGGSRQAQEPLLIDALVAEPPREMSGAVAFKGHKFHHAWAVCHLLELHGSPTTDYLLALEFHDDVIVLRPPTNPSSVDFYQVKSKFPGHWLISDLLRRKRKASISEDSENEAGDDTAADPAATLPTSILGKILHNARLCATHEHSLNFVSNAAFAKPLGRAGHAQGTLCLLDVDKETRAGIALKIQEELGLENQIALDNVYLHVTGLSHAEFDDNCVGRISRFLEQAYPGKTPGAASSLYMMIVKELERGAIRTDPISSVLDLKNRGVSRSAFQKLIDRAAFSVPEDWLRELLADLSAESWSVRERSSLHEGWREYMAATQYLHNDSYVEFVERVRDAAHQASNSPQFAKLSDLVNIAEAHFIEVWGPPERPFSLTLLKAGILYEYKAAEAGKFAEAAAKHAAATT